MNTPLITMDKETARAKLKAFRANTHRDAEEIYARTAEAYAVLAEGTPLVSLTQAIQAGGLFDDWRPKLAIARADRREVHFRWPACETRARYFTGNFRRMNVDEDSTLTRFVDMGRENGKQWAPKSRPTELSYVAAAGYALVPMVPADVRPRTGQLRDWFVLWEVTQWFDRPQSMKAPIDPLLLKHVGADLYAVLAQWDLTEVERFILQEVRAR